MLGGVIVLVMTGGWHSRLAERRGLTRMVRIFRKMSKEVEAELRLPSLQLELIHHVRLSATTETNANLIFSSKEARGVVASPLDCIYAQNITHRSVQRTRQAVMAVSKHRRLLKLEKGPSVSFSSTVNLSHAGMRACQSTKECECKGGRTDKDAPQSLDVMGCGARNFASVLLRLCVALAP